MSIEVLKQYARGCDERATETPKKGAFIPQGASMDEALARCQARFAPARRIEILLVRLVTCWRLYKFWNSVDNILWRDYYQRESVRIQKQIERLS